MRLVVDASVAVKWLIDEPGSDLADRLLDGEHDFVAPELLLAEVLNTAWRRRRQGEVSEAQFGAIARRARDMLIALRPLAPLAERAATLARELDHPVYDCFYLALAEAEQASFVTADRRLLARLAATAWGSRTMDLESVAGGG